MVKEFDNQVGSVVEVPWLGWNRPDPQSVVELLENQVASETWTVVLLLLWLVVAEVN